MLEAVRAAALRRQHSGLVEQSDPVSVDPSQFHELLCDPLCELTLDFTTGLERVDNLLKDCFLVFDVTR